MKINFVVAGDHKYFYLLQENCAHIKSVYPDARIILFDFGLTTGQAAKIVHGPEIQRWLWEIEQCQRPLVCSC